MEEDAFKVNFYYNVGKEYYSIREKLYDIRDMWKW